MLSWGKTYYGKPEQIIPKSIVMLQWHTNKLSVFVTTYVEGLTYDTVYYVTKHNHVIEFRRMTVLAHDSYCNDAAINYYLHYFCR